MLNYVLIFTLMNSITTVYSSYASMRCYYDGTYRNDWDGYHNNVQYGAFIAGMTSYHNNDKEDRRFKWKYCEPTGCSPIKGTGGLPETNYDAQWQRDCSSRNGGNSALIGGSSYHNNGREDRRWTFFCGDLVDDFYFAPGACSWTDYVNSWDKYMNYNCPSSGVLRGISSYHDNGREDRRWRFECCRVSARNSAHANQEMFDINDYVYEQTSGSQNRVYLMIAFISAGLSILCMIFGLYSYRKKKIMHKYLSNIKDEEMDEMEIAKLVM